MRVLLTGATGFVGSHLLATLVTGGSHAVAALLRPESDRWRIGDLLDRVEVLSGSLDSVEELSAKLERFAPEVLVHAAWAGVSGEQRNELAQVENVMATVRLLRVAHAAGTRHFVGLGSQAEYGAYPGRIHEGYATHPTTLYGTAKLCASLLAGKVCEALGVRFAWLRLFSAYGPKDDPSCFVPMLCRSLLAGERPRTTRGEQLWDFVYVEDAAEAVRRVAETPEASGVFNLGSGRVVSIREVAETVRDLAQPGAEIGFGEVPYGPGSIMHLEADIDRLRTATGWEPVTPLREGLARTVAWHRMRYACSPPRP